jgi:Family of unknown function (DUF5681)
MTQDEEKPRRADYAVGYGKPPTHTRFRKGRSGNPGGRPHGMTARRATALALKELYRLVPVREGDKLIKMPAIQLVLRSKVALAAKGNGPAQRALFEIARVLEKEREAEMAANEQRRAKTPISDLEAARRIAFLFAKVSKEQPGADKSAANVLLRTDDDPPSPAS